MRVLVAEDDPVCQLFVVRALKKLGHEPLTADDGEAAWQAFTAARPPLVITDWMMPKSSGLDLTRKIRAEKGSYTYIILATALSGEERTLDGFKAGADDYLVKPIDVAELTRRIQVAERIGKGMIQKTEALLRSSIERVQGAVGHEHQGLIDSLSDLASLYRTERAYTKARAFLRRQLAIVEKDRGPEHADAERLRAELHALTGLDDEIDAA